jgi:hypothetical protein
MRIDAINRRAEHHAATKPGRDSMKLAVWSTSAMPAGSNYREVFRRKLDEIELAERIGIDAIWFLEHRLIPTSPTPAPNS